jgi:hypothetical protein
MSNTELLAVIGILAVAAGIAIFWHWHVKFYVVAAIAAAISITIFGEVASYIELGYRSPWSDLAIMFSLFYSFIFSLLVGIPFAIKRNRKKQHAQTKA